MNKIKLVVGGYDLNKTNSLKEKIENISEGASSNSVNFEDLSLSENNYNGSDQIEEVIEHEGNGSNQKENVKIYNKIPNGENKKSPTIKRLLYIESDKRNHVHELIKHKIKIKRKLGLSPLSRQQRKRRRKKSKKEKILSKFENHKENQIGNENNLNKEIMEKE
ncbi:hypothetical protein ACQ4LE_003255 [Meloidogyne hapla]|uniref:Uncharacterized protein n=1 Tax=Meloidogyne hapla TaxID=6305 RepID=A0A1I8AXQ9_MELHA